MYPILNAPRASLPPLPPLPPAIQCVVCTKAINTSIDVHVHVGACDHNVHYACLLYMAESNGFETFLRTGLDDTTKLCAACTSGVSIKERENAVRAAERTNVQENGCVTREHVLQNMNAKFMKQHGVEFRLLTSLDAPQELARDFLGLPQKARYRLPSNNTAIDEDVIDVSGSNNAHEASFLARAVAAHITFNDILTRKDGSLLNVYRCGVVTKYDLARLNFSVLVHLKRSLVERSAVWQLCELYGVTLDDVVGARSIFCDTLKPTLRSFIDAAHITPADWTALGATVDGLRIIEPWFDKDTAKFMNMTLSRWQRYLRLQRHHLVMLKIVTRYDFVNIMKWDAAHPWCPAN